MSVHDNSKPTAGANVSASSSVSYPRTCCIHPRSPGCSCGRTYRIAHSKPDCIANCHAHCRSHGCAYRIADRIADASAST